MDNRFRGRIISHLRKLTWSWKPYNVVKNKAKVDKATYKCVKCEKYCYTGKSEKSLTELKVKYKMKTVVMDAIFIDHINPVIDPELGFENWDTFVERLFCPEDNLQPLCRVCHDKKSKKENKVRRK